MKRVPSRTLWTTRMRTHYALSKVDALKITVRPDGVTVSAGSSEGLGARGAAGLRPSPSVPYMNEGIRVPTSAV